MAINLMQRKGDYIAELSEYLKRNLKKGYTEESLKWALVGQGYPKLEVEKAIQKVHKDLASQAPILNTRPIIKHEIIEPKLKPEEKKSFWRKLFG
jgi:hypothetical protein